MTVPSAESPVALLLAHINEVADALDGGVFAPHVVQRLDLELKGRIFAELASDRSAALAHWPADDGSGEPDPRCPVDNEHVPCTMFRALMTTYDLHPHDVDFGGDVPARRDSGRPTTDERVIQTIDRIVSEIA